LTFALCAINHSSPSPDDDDGDDFFSPSAIDEERGEEAEDRGEVGEEEEGGEVDINEASSRETGS